MVLCVVLALAVPGVGVDRLASCQDVVRQRIQGGGWWSRGRVGGE